jgi:serine/threonine-protein kinase RsbW/stage II sporulation protein AB (anti-sigma F factor)
VEHTDNWTTQAVPEHARWLRTQVADFAERTGFVGSKVADVRLAVSEAVTNTIVHAYRDRSEPGLVSIRARADDVVLVVEVQDDGTGPQPRVDSPGAGLGMPMMATLAQSIHVERCPDGGTCVTLCFERDSSDQPKPRTSVVA